MDEMGTDIETRIVTEVRDVWWTGGDAVTRDTRFEQDLDMEDYDMTDLVCWLEDAFKIEIPDEDVMAMDTVGQVIDYVKRRTDS